MSNLLEILLGNALEATVLAMIVGLATLAVRCPAPLRHALWLLVLVKLLLPPSILPPLGAGALVSWVSTNLAPQPADDAIAAADDVAVVAAEASTIAVPESPSTIQQLPSPLIAAYERGRSLWRLLWPAIWATGSVAVAVWAVVRIIAVERRLRLAADAPDDVLAAATLTARRMGLAGVPRVRVAVDCRMPLVWALGPPAIVLPAMFVRHASDDSLRNVLAHELAHLKRRDHWTCWLELAAGCVFWWLPTFWWAQRQLRQAADQAADAWAVWTLGSRKTYAESLLASIELCCARPLGQPALGWSWGGRETVARRLTMIMRDPVRHRMSGPAWLIAGVVGMLALPAISDRSLAQSDDDVPRREARERERRERDESPEARRDGERRVQIEIRRDGGPREEGPRDGDRREIEPPDEVRRSGDRNEPRRDGDYRTEERRVIISRDGERPTIARREGTDARDGEGRVLHYRVIGPDGEVIEERVEGESGRPRVHVSRQQVGEPRQGGNTDQRLRELEEKVDLLLREIRELRQEAFRPAPARGYGYAPAERTRDDDAPRARYQPQPSPAIRPGPPARPAAPARAAEPARPDPPARPARPNRNDNDDDDDRPRDRDADQASAAPIPVPAP